MSDWWTYRLSSFLMYSPRSYARMLELYGQDLWPGPLLALASGMLALWLAWRGTGASRRVLAFLLAAAWAWVGWAFHAQRYATIFLAAPYLALAFELQAPSSCVRGAGTCRTRPFSRAARLGAGLGARLVRGHRLPAARACRSPPLPAGRGLRMDCGPDCFRNVRAPAGHGLARTAASAGRPAPHSGSGVLHGRAHALGGRRQQVRRVRPAVQPHHQGRRGLKPGRCVDGLY